MDTEHPFVHPMAIKTLVIILLNGGCSTPETVPPAPGVVREHDDQSTDQRAGEQTDEPEQNPMAGLFGALGSKGETAKAGEVVSAGTTVTLIPWRSLSRALPVGGNGWTRQGEPEGSTSEVRGIPVPQASCQLGRGQLSAKVSILDTFMNPLLAMPFNMARTVEIDSVNERIGPTSILNHPATQKYKKGQQKAEVLIMVGSRILVKIQVHGAANETPAVELAKSLNLALLSEFAGGQE